MYESPISITELYTKKAIEARDDSILWKVKEVYGVDVEKEELLRALKYDRGQYEKGYSEGFKIAVEMLASRIHHEILDARSSNFKAIDERREKYESTYDNDPFLHYCQGKIHSLDGIDYFIETIVKEMKKADDSVLVEKGNNYERD
jgi:hypothetical protein